MIVVGLDVCKASVVACALSQRTIEPRKLKDKLSYPRFRANAKGLIGLFELNPDLVILEPTGTNYSKFWVDALESKGVEVRLVDHSQARSYRKMLLQGDSKNDRYDAFALAHYGLEYLNQPERFLRVQGAKVRRIRYLVLRLDHLTSCQSPIVNNLKQLLAWQFPERAQVKMRRLNGKVNPFVRWAAEGCPHRIYDPQHERTAGAGLSDESRFHAQRLLSIQTEVLKLELELEELLCGEQFTVYRRVFERFGFGDRLQGAILAHAYPLEEILDEHKRPVKERRRGTISGKMVTNNISRRKFQNILGCVPGEDSSGDMFRSRVTGGSELVRKLLWLWQLTRIEPKGSRPKSLVCQELGDAMDRRKATGEPVRKLRMRQLSVTAKFLFNHLVAELHT